MKTIKLTSFALAMAISMSLVSCGDDDSSSTPTLPPIGGYNSSDDVSGSNLVAKWSFENNLVESKSGITGTGTRAGFTEGAKGMAWQGSSTEDRYAVFNGLNNVGTVSSFTYSIWLNTAGTVAPGETPGIGKGAQGIFALVKPDQFWGAMNLFLENPDSSKPNRFLLKLLIENKRTGVVWGSQSPVFNVDDALNTWTHVVFTYDASTSRFTVYKDGIQGLSLSGAYAPTDGFPGTLIAYANDPGDATNMNNAPLWGNLDFGGSFSTVVLGSQQFETTPSLTTATGGQDWATSFAGKMDEFRIYKAALTAAEVNAIYELEKAGR